MMMVPVRMTQDELLAVLDDVRGRVAIGDSWEGSLTYLMPEDGGDGFDVQATYRVGNLQGQGGYRIYGREVEDLP